jgi:hypothetical protein
MADPQPHEDIDFLADKFSELLSVLAGGKFVVDGKIMKLPGALRRVGRDKEWALRGLCRMMQAHEVVLTVVGGAVANYGLDRFMRHMRERYPDEFVKEADAEVVDDGSA